MYGLLRRYAEEIIGSISEAHVASYEGLLQNLAAADDEVYQQQYRQFWAMNAAMLTQTFRDEYFQILSEQPNVGIRELLAQLYDPNSPDRSKRTLQFSFATKLVHMHNPTLPIFDSRVMQFYGLKVPTPNVPKKYRIERCCQIHAFLDIEYDRVRRNRLLAEPIQLFKDHFDTVYFSDEKIIDSLIWGYIRLVKSGAVQNGVVVYR